MKLLFFADSHLGFDFPVNPRIQRRRRGVDFFNNYHHILKTATAERVDLVLHGGDVFFRSRIPLPIIQRAYEPLLEVLDSGIDLLMVPGNHERSRLPVSSIYRHPKLHLFDRPRSYVIERNSSRVAFGGIPNIRNNVAANFSSAVSESGILEEAASHRVLCLHQSIEGAVVGAHNFRFRKGPDVISLDQFPKDLDLILSGHIHRQQVLKSRHGTPVIYPGSIERTSFAERLETKGYYLIKITQTGINLEFRPLPARPMIELTLSDSLLDEMSMHQEILSKLPEWPDDTILRVRCTSKQQLDNLKIRNLRSLLPASYNVDVAPPPQSMASRMKSRSW